MNFKKEYVAAIDIGTTKIVAVLGKRNPNGKIEILGMTKTVSKGVKRGVVQNIDETVAAIQTVVNDVQQKTGAKISDVFVGIAGQHIKSVKNRGYINRDSYDDEITNDDVKRLIEDAHKIPIEMGDEIIHVLPQNFIVDSETGIKNPVGMSGKRLEANFHIVIGNVASIKNIEKCVNRVGLRIHDVMLEPLASAAAVLTEDEMEAGVVLVDIGGGTTDIAVYHEGVIRHTAVIPFGGNVVTKDIKEGCAILERQAEELKIKFGSSLGDISEEDKVVIIPGISGRDSKEISFKSLAYIIQARMEEIIDAMMFEIESSECMDKLSAGIVITGGGAMLRHLQQLVRFRTGMDVRIGYPNAHLAGNVSDDINQPMFATSVGLLMRGYEFIDSEWEGNKLPPIEEVLPPRPVAKPEVKVQPEVKPEPVMVETTPPTAPVREERAERSKPKSNMIDKLKRSITEIFDVDDNSSKM
ncbi:MAG: cell division protein FtsA [Bacteroidota bacterium]|nr:cell division protein FtsA [Bacteroidota bacterium]